MMMMMMLYSLLTALRILGEHRKWIATAVATAANTLSISTPQMGILSKCKTEIRQEAVHCDEHAALSNYSMKKI